MSLSSNVPFYFYLEGEFSIPVSPSWIPVNFDQMTEIVQEVTSEEHLEALRIELLEEEEDLVISADSIEDMSILKSILWLRQHKIDREIRDLFSQHVDKDEACGMMVSVLCGVICAVGYQHDVRRYWRHFAEPGWGRLASYHYIMDDTEHTRGDCIGPLDAMPRETRDHLSFLKRFFPCIFS